MRRFIVLSFHTNISIDRHNLWQQIGITPHKWSFKVKKCLALVACLWGCVFTCVNRVETEMKTQEICFGIKFCQQRSLRTSQHNSWEKAISTHLMFVSDSYLKSICAPVVDKFVVCLLCCREVRLKFSIIQTSMRRHKHGKRMSHVPCSQLLQEDVQHFLGCPGMCQCDMVCSLVFSFENTQQKNTGMGQVRNNHPIWRPHSWPGWQAPDVKQDVWCEHITFCTSTSSLSSWPLWSPGQQDVFHSQPQRNWVLVEQDNCFSSKHIWQLGGIFSCCCKWEQDRPQEKPNRVFYSKRESTPVFWPCQTDLVIT